MVAAAVVAFAAALAAAGPASAASPRPAKPSPLRVISTSADTVVVAWKRTARRFVVSKNFRRQAVVRTRVYTFRDSAAGARSASASAR